MDYPVKMPTMKASKKDLEAIKKEITKSGPTSKPKVLRGEEAAKQLQKDNSPSGVAKRDADIKKALEAKYPGMFLPSTRTTPGVRRP